VKNRTWGTAAIALAVAATSCDDDADMHAYDQARPRVTLNGVGATVSRALFAKWADQYALVDPSTTLHYDPAGSGAGVRAALDGTSDFGTSDSPLSDADAAARHDVLHVPVAVEAIAIVYSLAGMPSGARLQMNEDVVADAMLGKLAWWDDAAIAALNPGVKLPHTAIRPAYRGDQSGSSYLLAEWLSKTSRHWSIAPTRTLTLPSGVAAQKDDGMLARLRGTDGSLGYLSAVTAFAEHVPSVAVRNAAGRFVQPSLEGMRAAASAADLGPDLRAHAVAAPGDLAYPICSFTFVLVRVDGGAGASRRSLARFLWWATHDGQSFGPPLGFGALPGELQIRDEGVIRALRAAGEAAM
jgi:phosphate transport system substrate-binding protein